MSKIKNELKSIAVELNNFLGSYIRIHDAVFRFSWRKSIPLPFIFKVIDFNDLYSQAAQILSELETRNQQINNVIKDTTPKQKRFAHFLSDYCTALIETVSLLKEILHQLYLKSQRSNKYSLNEHKKQCGLYQNAVDKHVSIGSQLNELYRELHNSSKLDYDEIEDVLKKWNKNSAEEVYWELKMGGAGEDIARRVTSGKDLLDKYLQLRNRLRQKGASRKGELLKSAFDIQELIAKGQANSQERRRS